MRDKLAFFIDENVPPAILQPLQNIYRKHRFRTAEQEVLRGVDDKDLFQALQEREFDAIITQDGKQLERDDERSMLEVCNLHWIGIPPIVASGVHQVALLTGVVASGLHHVIGGWMTTPHAYYLQAPANLANMAPEAVPLRQA